MLVSKSSQQTLSWLVYRPLHVRPSVEVARPVFSVFLALTTKFISWGLRLDFDLRHSAIQFPLDQNDVENPLSVARYWKTTWSKTWQFDHERIEPPHNTKQSLRKHWLLVKHYWSEKKMPLWNIFWFHTVRKSQIVIKYSIFRKNFVIFLKIEFLDTIWDFLTVWILAKKFK